MTEMIIVPGWQNSEPEHWQSIWQTKFNGTRVNQNDWMNPNHKDWIDQLNQNHLSVSNTTTSGGSQFRMQYCCGLVRQSSFPSYRSIISSTTRLRTI